MASVDYYSRPQVVTRLSGITGNPGTNDTYSRTNIFATVVYPVSLYQLSAKDSGTGAYVCWTSSHLTTADAPTPVGSYSDLHTVARLNNED